MSEVPFAPVGPVSPVAPVEPSTIKANELLEPPICLVKS